MNNRNFVQREQIYFTENLMHWRIPGATYDVVFCTHNRRVLSPDARTCVLSAINFWHNKKIEVILAVVMPDHVHLLSKPLKSSPVAHHDISSVIRSVKSFTGNKINRLENTLSFRVWQPDFYNRVVRDENELYLRSRYILENPVRANLVTKCQHYPWVMKPL